MKNKRILGCEHFRTYTKKEKIVMLIGYLTVIIFIPLYFILNLPEPYRSNGLLLLGFCYIIFFVVTCCYPAGVTLKPTGKCGNKNV